MPPGSIYQAVLAAEPWGLPGPNGAGHPACTMKAKQPIQRHRRGDVVITEIGGTVGDIEILPFLEAVRQFRNEAGRDNVLCARHACALYRPEWRAKTKPTQHSAIARSRGIQPDVIVCRVKTSRSATS